MHLIAHYKCMKCGHEFSRKPGPTECAKCGHLYLDWLNYEEIVEKVRSEYVQQQKNQDGGGVMTKPQRVTGTREWAKYNENCITGCSHDCWYCYAKEMAVRFKRRDATSWKNMEPRVVKVRKRDGRIMFPTTHDITPETLDLCFSFIEENLKLGNELLIVSKPHLVCIEKMVKAFRDYKDQILFRFTIGSPIWAVLHFWEPNAPTFVERLQCLQLAHAAGYSTSVSCEPMLSSNADMIRLFYMLEKYVTDSIWLGKLNKPMARLKQNGASDMVMDEAKMIVALQTDEEIFKLYEMLKDELKVKWKDSIKEVVGIPTQTEDGQDV